MFAHQNPHIEVGVASRTLRGHSESGDLHIVQPIPEGVLLAAIDGLGHGAQAATAARAALETIASHPREPIVALVKRCHEDLKATRGVVIGIARIEFPHNSMTWLAVGDVDCVLLRHARQTSPAYETIIQRGGVLGYRLPPLHPHVLSIAPGDTLIMTTDGIDGSFDYGALPTDNAQELADSICTLHGKGTDDALVLVAKYLGNSQ